MGESDVNSERTRIVYGRIVCGVKIADQTNVWQLVRL